MKLNELWLVTTALAEFMSQRNNVQYKIFHLEEWDEDVRGGESKQDQSQERGEASIEDCWAYGVQWGDCSTDTCSWNIEE